jgi:hypothetical protein
MTSWLKKGAEILRVHWLAVLLVSIGTWLRFTHLPDQGILFGDSGRELLAAAESVNKAQLPTPQPGFLTIWIETIIYRWVGYQPAAYYWIFAGIGSVTLVALYEFCLVWLNQRMGLVALTLLSFSPLAIAQSRMVYHTAPIIFLTVLGLWAVAAVWRQLQSPHPQWQTVTGGCLGIVLFLFPQVLSAPTDKSPQLSSSLLSNFTQLISFSTTLTAQLVLGLLLVSFLIWGGWQWWRNGHVLTPGKAAIGLVIGLVSLGRIYGGVSSPSDWLCYCVLLPLLVALSWEELPRWGKWVGVSGLLILSGLNVLAFHQQHWLVDQSHPGSYGPSLGTHQQLLSWAAIQTHQVDLLLVSQNQSAHAFDSYIWVSRGLNLKVSDSPSTSLAEVAQPRLILDVTTSEAQPASFIFTTFHGNLPWSKTLYTPSVTARLLP